MEEYGVSGQNLRTVETKKKYNIKQGDKFYEPINEQGGGIWILNYSNTDEPLKGEKEPELTLEIVELEENTVTIKEEPNQTMGLINDNKTMIHNIGYNEEYKIYSRNLPVIDGENYSYTIKITKKK